MEGVVNDGDNQDELLNLPPGFRFHPTDEEIITHYLSQKVVNGSFTATAIGEVDLNKCEPWDLPKKAKMGEKECFFFCQKDRKYPTGMRTNRATESGYWKATGKDKEIYSKGKDRRQLIGMKKTLVFYKGRAPKGEKSNWVMHEFRLEGKFSYYNFPKSPKDEWVVCRVVHKNTGTIKTSPTRDLTSINSFVEGLLETPSLPPLAGSPYFNNKEKPNDHSTYTKISGTSTEDDIKGTLLVHPSMNNQQLQMQPENYSFFNPTTYHRTATSTNYQVPNAILYQNAIRYRATSSSTVGCAHQQRISNSIPNVLGSANLMQPANQALGRQLKAEQLSSNQSIVSRSQDTGLSTDMTTEISSKQEVDEGNQYQDLDSFWSY